MQEGEIVPYSDSNQNQLQKHEKKQRQHKSETVVEEEAPQFHEPTVTKIHSQTSSETQTREVQMQGLHYSKQQETVSGYNMAVPNSSSSSSSSSLTQFPNGDQNASRTPFSSSSFPAETFSTSTSTSSSPIPGGRKEQGHKIAEQTTTQTINGPPILIGKPDAQGRQMFAMQQMNVNQTKSAVMQYMMEEVSYDSKGNEIRRQVPVPADFLLQGGQNAAIMQQLQQQTASSSQPLQIQLSSSSSSNKK